MTALAPLSLRLLPVAHLLGCSREASPSATAPEPVPQPSSSSALGEARGAAARLRRATEFEGAAAIAERLAALAPLEWSGQEPLGRVHAASSLHAEAQGRGADASASREVAVSAFERAVAPADCGESHAACNRPNSRIAASPSLAVGSLEHGVAGFQRQHAIVGILLVLATEAISRQAAPLRERGVDTPNRCRTTLPEPCPRLW